MRNIDKILILVIAILVATSVTLNIKKQYSIDKSKLPTKLETNSNFQKWLTNAKNKGIKIEGDNFRYVEEKNIYNTIWTSTASSDDEESFKLYNANMELLKKYKFSALSPNERETVNFDSSPRFGFNPNEVFFYGLREDKILTTKVTDCNYESNCFFNRAGFLDNQVFFVIELSLNDSLKNPFQTCDKTTLCTYSFKVHLIDLINNSRTVYQSEPFQGYFQELAGEL